MGLLKGFPCRLQHGSGARFWSPFAKRRQPIAKTYPRDVVSKPRVMGWRKQFRVVEAAGRDVDGFLRPTVLVRQRSSARRAKGAANRWRRTKLHRTPLQELEPRFREGHPCDHRRRRNSPTRSTVADHRVRRFAGDAVSNRSADAASFSDCCRHVASLHLALDRRSCLSPVCASRTGQAPVRAGYRQCTVHRSARSSRALRAEACAKALPRQ